MAEIYRIGSDDLIDRVSTFGGTNLMRASGCSDWDAQWYSTTAGFEFMGDRIKIPGGADFKTSKASNLYTADHTFFCPIGTSILFSTYIYENTLTSENTNDKISFYYYFLSGAGGSGSSAKSFNLNTTGFVCFTAPTFSYDQLKGIYFGPRTNSTVSGYITIGPLKVEIGSKPTDWTPSPYDLVTYDSSSESLVFFQ